MDKKRIVRMLLALVGAVGAVVALFVLLVMLNAGQGFADCTGAQPLGWLLPPVAGLLIGGTAWVLLFKAPHYSEDDEEATRHSVPCPSCAKAVMPDWRLCPYCGRVLPSSAAVGE